MKIIENNPYRYLGVYANASVKERMANSAKLKAFLKVGKQPDFPLDLRPYLPPVARTAESVAKAEADLTLPNEQVRCAQFWFIKSTPIDTIAFNHLFAGSMDEAVELWKKKECLSSLQNRMMCYLLKGKYVYAAGVADRLYQKYSSDFCSLIAPTLKLGQEDFINKFFDTLASEHDVDLGSFSWERCSQRWKDILNERLISPVISQIEGCIDSAKDVKRDNPSGRYNAGVKLMKDTKPLIVKLHKVCSEADIRYQNVMDKLANEILQCGIDYYNKSDDDDKGVKAMPLQKYALQIAVGPMAKSRCKDNVDILQKNIDSLPPKEIRTSVDAITNELKNNSLRYASISNAVTLLNNCKPHLAKMKAVVGVTDASYLKISTVVVSVALGQIIDEVNEAQDGVGEGVNLSTQILVLSKLKDVLRSAWSATLLMDKFDMEAQFKMNRYVSNRRVLKNLCDQLGISTTPSAVHVEAKTPRPTVRPVVSPRPTVRPQPRPSISPQSSKSSGEGCLDESLGCIGQILIIGFIFGIIGALISTCS